jgi:hypothetical protein
VTLDKAVPIFIGELEKAAEAEFVHASYPEAARLRLAATGA